MRGDGILIITSIHVSSVTRRRVYSHNALQYSALIPQFLGDFAPRPLAGTVPPAHPLGAQPPDPRFAPQHELLDPLLNTAAVNYSSV